MRAAAVAALLLGLAAPASPQVALGELAGALAREAVRQAGGRPLELSPAIDRTGRGAGLALDFDEVLRTRVAGIARLASEGSRLQVQPVLADAPGRLIVSARLVAQPEGRLEDLVSLSVEADTRVLALAARPPLAAAGQVDVLGSTRSAPIAGRVLDMAFMGGDRLLLLNEDGVSLYRLAEGTLVLLARQPLAGREPAVRHAGGLLRAVERERSVWAATSRSAGAVLFGVEESGLVERQQAGALPWPRSRAGLRFRPGTDLIEGGIEGLGGGPFLHVEDAGLAVDREGRLLGASGGADALRIGAPLAVLWPRHVAASTALPPGERDAVLVLSLAPPLAPRTIAELPVSGAVRALAAHASGGRARLAAAVEEAGAHGELQTHLVVFDLAAAGMQP